MKRFVAILMFASLAYAYFLSKAAKEHQEARQLHVYTSKDIYYIDTKSLIVELETCDSVFVFDEPDSLVNWLSDRTAQDVLTKKQDDEKQPAGRHKRNDNST